MPEFAVLVEFLVEAETETEAEDKVEGYERAIKYDREGLINVSILGANQLEWIGSLSGGLDLCDYPREREGEDNEG